MLFELKVSRLRITKCARMPIYRQCQTASTGKTSRPLHLCLEIYLLTDLIL